MKPRKRHLTARIKPATKHALMAQLAAIADGIIHERIAQEMAAGVMLHRIHPPRPWYARLMWWRK